MSFEVNPLTDDLIAIKNQTAIARSLRNLVLTTPGERFFNNEIGSQVNNLLFNNVDDVTAVSIRSEIINVIERCGIHNLFGGVQNGKKHENAG